MADKNDPHSVLLIVQITRFLSSGVEDLMVGGRSTVATLREGESIRACFLLHGEKR